MAEDVSLNLEIEKRDGYLYALYRGDPLTLGMIVKTINAVAEAIRSGGFTRVLLVRDAPLLDSDQNRALVAGLIKQNITAGVKFAIVDKFGNDPAAAARAVEASRKAGWDLTAFDTIEKAEEWLKGS